MISVHRHSSEAFKNIKPEYCACAILANFINRIEIEIIHKECKIGRLEVTMDFSKISNFQTWILHERSVLGTRLIFQELS